MRICGCNHHALERVLLSALDGTPTASRALEGNRDRQRAAGGGLRGGDGNSHCHRQGKGVGRAARFTVIPKIDQGVAMARSEKIKVEKPEEIL